MEPQTPTLSDLREVVSLGWQNASPAEARQLIAEGVAQEQRLKRSLRLLNGAIIANLAIVAGGIIVLYVVAINLFTFSVGKGH